MKKTILFITIGLSTMLWANTPAPTTKDMETKKSTKSLQRDYQIKQQNRGGERRALKKVQKQERQLKNKRAMKRDFKTHNEFKKMKHYHTKKIDHKTDNRRMGKDSKNIKAVKRSSHHSNYSNDRHSYRDYKRKKNHRNRAYRHTKNSWHLAYRYERASFYDRHGYYYGYFNRRGYMFEGDFYRYDRYYTYRDRVRGKGLFEHRYYRPIVDRYYSHFNGRHSRKW